MDEIDATGDRCDTCGDVLVGDMCASDPQHKVSIDPLERITYPDVTAETVREHLRDVHGDADWQSDVEPMSLHRLIHTDAADAPGEPGWQQGHLHPEYPLTWAAEPETKCRDCGRALEPADEGDPEGPWVDENGDRECDVTFRDHWLFSPNEPPLPQEEQIGITLTRGQLEAWAGRKLTNMEVERLDEAVPHSSIPEAIAVIVDNLDLHGRVN